MNDLDEYRIALADMPERERQSCPDCGKCGIACRQCAGDEREESR